MMSCKLNICWWRCSLVERCGGLRRLAEVSSRSWRGLWETNREPASVQFITNSKYTATASDLWIVMLNLCAKRAALLRILQAAFADYCLDLLLVLLSVNRKMRNCFTLCGLFAVAR